MSPSVPFVPLSLLAPKCLLLSSMSPFCISFVLMLFGVSSFLPYSMSSAPLLFQLLKLSILSGSRRKRETIRDGKGLLPNSKTTCCLLQFKVKRMVRTMLIRQIYLGCFWLFGLLQSLNFCYFDLSGHFEIAE